MQPTLQQWLARKPAGPKPKRRLPKMSSKRQREAKAYSLLRAAYMKAHPLCQKCGRARSQDLHHRAGRLGGNYLNTDTWAALCRNCHRACHDHPSEARADGWLTT